MKCKQGVEVGLKPFRSTFTHSWPFNIENMLAKEIRVKYLEFGNTIELIQEPNHQTWRFSTEAPTKLRCWKEQQNLA